MAGHRHRFQSHVPDAASRRRKATPTLQKLISSLAVFKLGHFPPLKCFQRTLGQMAAASPVCKLGLLHMQPLQLWLKGLVSQSAWHVGNLCIKVRTTAGMRLPLGMLTLSTGSGCTSSLLAERTQVCLSSS